MQSLTPIGRSGEFDPCPPFTAGRKTGLIELTRRIGLPVVDKVHKIMTFHTCTPAAPWKKTRMAFPNPGHRGDSATLLFVACVGYAPAVTDLGYGGST
jgi:5-formyltetrahydrofolate cyclo-ligase